MSQFDRLAVSVVFLSAVVGCAGGPKPAQEAATSVPVPSSLTLDRTVSGPVFGRPLKAPEAIAVDKRGSVYLLDSGNKRVVWYNQELVPVRDFSGQGSETGKLNDPRGLCIDPGRNVWISDYGSKRLLGCNGQLEFATEIEFRDETDEFRLGRPGSLAVTNFGEFWVADLDNHRIAVLDQVGQIGQLVGDAGSPGGQLFEITKVIADSHDRIYVCDRGDQRIVVYDDRGGLVTEIKHSALADPVSIALDAHGRVWVLEQETGKLHCFDKDGRYLSSVGPIISGADQPPARPSDMVFLPDGRLVIVDTGHDRLLVCRVTGSQ